MSLIGNIGATWRGPRRVMARMLEAGEREDRALALVMGGCTGMFLADWPRLARQSFVTGEDLQMLLGGSLLGLVFILPLFLYLLAALSHLVMRVLGGRGTWFGARLALFWALVAAMPLMLLHGLVAGLIGPGAAKSAVGLLWLGVFLWFWIGGLMTSEGLPAKRSTPA